jgi:hypothetical protein
LLLRSRHRFERAGAFASITQVVPYSARDLSDHEQQALEDALGADHAFTRRRARVLRFSAF